MSSDFTVLVLECERETLRLFCFLCVWPFIYCFVGEQSSAVLFSERYYDKPVCLNISYIKSGLQTR